MISADKCFVGEGIKSAQKLLDKLNKGIVIKSFEIVAFVNGGNRLEIYNSRIFNQKYFKKQDYEVAALFNSQGEAFEYIRILSELSVRTFGKFDARKAYADIPLELIKLTMESEGVL